MSEIHFWWHFWPFQIHTDLNNFFKCLTKWPPTAILDVQKSLLIAFLAISDKYAFFNHKMAAGSHLDDRKSLSIAFLAISDQYETFIFFTKWLPAAILDDRKSLSITFVAISDQYTTYFFWIFFQNGHWRPLWKSDLRFFHYVSSMAMPNMKLIRPDQWIYDTVRDATSFLSIVIQNGGQRPFCFFRLMPKIIRFLLSGISGI